MNKKYYFKHFFLSLTIGFIISYKIFSSPLTSYKQYLFLLWIISCVFLYPIAHYTLETSYSYFIHSRIERNKFIDNPAFFRMKEYFCFFVSFLFSIPISFCLIIYKYLKKGRKL